jgi:hypothetical protein
VHWTRVAQSSFAIVGEIDFAIVGPTGKLLLVEQKSGFLAETPEGLVKRYAERDKACRCCSPATWMPDPPPAGGLCGARRCRWTPCCTAPTTW